MNSHSTKEMTNATRHDLPALAGTLNTLHTALYVDGVAPKSVERLLKLAIAKVQSLSSRSKTQLPPIPQSFDGYASTIEREFTEAHPEVSKWNGYFRDRMLAVDIFGNFQRLPRPRSLARAQIVGEVWHHFSNAMPLFLCQACAMLSSNQLRHYAIQTAFEELGMRDSNEIHPDLFRRTLDSVGATRALPQDAPVYTVVRSLHVRLKACRDDGEILGLLLGLEIPAIENITSVLESLSFDSKTEAILRESRFFKLHLAIELEHVRLTLSNYLRFCKDSTSRAQFVEGFDAGISFWREFWNGAAELIVRETELHV